MLKNKRIRLLGIFIIRQEKDLYSLIQRKSLIEMLKSNFKRIVFIFNLSILLCTLNNCQSQSEFHGNIKINSSSLQKLLTGFYSYMTDAENGNLNSRDYYVRINLSSIDDTTEYAEISLYRYDVARLEKNANGFYGYLKRNNTYFIFSTSNRLIAKDSAKKNPRLFSYADNLEKPLPKPQYDPYRWESVIRKDKIIRKSPHEVIEKYMGRKPGA